MPTSTSPNSSKIRTADASPARIYNRVRARAIVLAFLLMIINDYWIVQLEVVRYSFATYAAPFYNCIFTLLLITAANALVKKRFPRLALTRIELLAIYAMVSISSAVCSHNMMEILVSLMGYASFFKTPENNWDNIFFNRIPKWLTVSDHDSLRNFYYGGSSIYNPSNFSPWITPILCWSAFCAVLLFTMLCLNSILRKQWIESERLTFPIVILPLEMTQESGELFKNRHMWMGFAIAGIITFIAGLNYLYPNIPCIHIVRQNYGRYITTPPWNAMGSITIGFYFWAIGLAFLMPLELSFSCWFFYWLIKLELVLCRITGLNELSVPSGGGFERVFPFLNSQSYGAYIGFFVMSMWTSRHYLARVFRTAFLGTGEEDESNEAITYRSAILGALAGFIFLGLFARAMGMSLWVILIFFIFYFIFAIIISRIRAEFGFPTHDMRIMCPQYLIMTLAGTAHLPKQDLIGFSLFSWFNRTYASHPSPHQLEAFKLSERSSALAKDMFRVVLIAGIFAMPIGFWMLLHNYYIRGGATAHVEMWALGLGRESWQLLTNWINTPTQPNSAAMTFVGVGFIGSILLGMARVRFIWFPLHPLAYALASSWGVEQLWMPLMIGCIAKFITLKFGGLKQYRRALPFFFGLILGEITVGSLWTIIGIILNMPTYDFWPGRMG